MTPGLTPGSTPTTPGSQADPFDDQLWFQFLNELNSDGSSDFNKILEDADDANDDPDFILAGDNCVEESLDPDDERIQVPSKWPLSTVAEDFIQKLMVIRFID